MCRGMIVKTNLFFMSNKWKLAMFFYLDMWRAFMKKAMLSPWHTICLITVAGVLAALRAPAAPPLPKAEPVRNTQR